MCHRTNRASTTTTPPITGQSQVARPRREARKGLQKTAETARPLDTWMGSSGWQGGSRLRAGTILIFASGLLCLPCVEVLCVGFQSCPSLTCRITRLGDSGARNYPSTTRGRSPPSPPNLLSFDGNTSFALRRSLAQRHSAASTCVPSATHDYRAAVGGGFIREGCPFRRSLPHFLATNPFLPADILLYVSKFYQKIWKRTPG